MGKPRPRKNPGGNKLDKGNKPSKLPSFKKKKNVENAESTEGKSRKKSQRSVWGFAGLLTGLVSLFGFITGTQRKKKQTRDKLVLSNMMKRPLRYTQHAACRMECRFISKPEVMQTLATGSVNDFKSQPRLRPCPKYVVDAHIGEGTHKKNVQAVFSACSDATHVVTVIDKDTNWACPPC